MKVYISKYRDHWISPYTILEKILFWKDWKNISYETPWVEKWSNILLPLSKAYQTVMDKIHPKINYVKIDRWDVWNMDSTLSPIILPMLKKLKEIKHGSGLVDLHDVPKHLRATTTQDYDDQQTFDFYNENVPDGPDVHTRYDWVLDEMIWTFEQLCMDWEEQYWITKPELDLDKYPEDEGKETFPVRWKVEGECDWDGRMKHQKRIDNGLALFGKYYQTLWD